MFDLSTINLEADSDRGACLTLRHPQTGLPITFEKDGETKTMKIWVLGPDSKKARQAQADLLRSARSDMSEEEAERRAAKYTASITTKFENIVWEGEIVEFSRDIAEEVYLKQNWIRNQVDRFQSDRANFFVGSPES